MTRTRTEFSDKVKVQAFERCGGCCDGCGVKIVPGNGPEYDHRLPDALGGTATLENCDVLCRNCHGAKTAKVDVPAIARAKRLHRKQIGAASKPRSKLAGGKDGRWKRKVGGGVEQRACAAWRSIGSIAADMIEGEE